MRFVAFINEGGNGDCDNDGDVDMIDFVTFQLCFSGPLPSVPVCSCSDFDGDGDVDSTDKGTPGTDCTGTVSGACRILDLDFDGDYDSADATLFDSLPQGLARHPGRTATALDQQFAHQGLLFEPELGSYQNRARQYHPQMRRFLARDPAQFGDGLNLYAYLRGNPAVLLDPSGRDAICCCAGEAIMVALAVGLPCSRAAKDAADNALVQAPIAFATAGACHNNQCDAFRHCYWSCLITINPNCGPARAKLVTSAHEACDDENPAGEEAMDEQNNGVGRGIGSEPGADDSSCYTGCYNAVVNAGPGNPGGPGVPQTAPGGTPPASPFPHCRD